MADLLSVAERLNLSRWPGDEGGLNESTFLKLHLPGGVAFWVRYTLRRPRPRAGEPLGCLWAVLTEPDGHTIGCEPYASDAVATGTERFWVRIGPGEVSMGRALGRVATPAGPMEWDLRYETGGPCLAHLADSLYRGRFPRNKLASPHVSTRFWGRIAVAGRELEVRRAPGMQGHNWGPGVAPWWAWAHANAFEDEPDAVFEAVTSRTTGPLPFPPLTVTYLRVRGREFLWNGPLQAARAHSEVQGLRWKVASAGGPVSVEAEFQADPARTVGLGYRSSDGTTVPCWNSNVADATLTVRGLAGGPLTLKARGTATLELGGGAATGADVRTVVTG